MKEPLYHGTEQQKVKSILLDGLREGSCFATDPAFALSWKNETLIILDSPSTLNFNLEPGTRITPWGFTCSQYRIPKGATVPHTLLREATEEELAKWRVEIEYLDKNSSS